MRYVQCLRKTNKRRNKQNTEPIYASMTMPRSETNRTLGPCQYEYTQNMSSSA